MKWRFLAATVLVSCAYDPPVSSPLPLLPPAPLAATTKALRLMSDHPTTLHAGTASFSPPDSVIRNLHILGSPPMWGSWNGTAFEVPVNPAWPRIFIPNPTRANFIHLAWSSDLRVWNPVGYFTNCTEGVMLVDATGIGERLRFYRISAMAP